MNNYQLVRGNHQSFYIYCSLFIVHCSLFIACGGKGVEREVAPAFYHWQTEFLLTDFEKKYLDNFFVKKIYVKYFDVDWDASRGVPLPLAEVIFAELPKEVEIIPTVFITNRSLKNYPLEKMEELGGHILDKIFEIKRPTSEVQIDCDWTVGTKEKYFRLLNFFQKKLNAEDMQLSATIRLHQVKYFERTGVPPVDRGMLMFYNTGEVQHPDTENSILDLAIARRYFQNFEEYPLDLDVALPIFSWGVLFRNGKMIKLINNLRAEDLEDENRFSKIDETHFQVIKSTYLDGRYLYAEDVIRLEKVTAEELEDAAKSLRPLISNTNLTVSFYHLDSETIKHYPYEKLQNIYHFFK